MAGIRFGRIAVVGMVLLTTACGALTSGVHTAPAFPSDLPSLAPTRTAAAHPSASATAMLPPSVLRAAPPVAGPWNLVFSDDFDGDRLDGDDWVTCYDWNDDGCTNAGHRELEWYLPGQVAVANGALDLFADKTPTYGTDGRMHSWTSGMASTGRQSWYGTPHFTLEYGYIAAAIQIPAQKGMFPSFWMMPAGTRTTPPEIDIMEGIQSSTRVQMTLHWTNAQGKDVHSAVQWGPEPYTTGYHVFAVDWEKNSITWYIDGVPRYRVTDTALIPRVPMELLLNLAVGFPKSPPVGVDSAEMKVDWVRAWQH
ncbi:glycoside hydrolase family 16 protein [Streptacidiphilus sp. PB12-B1b]|uniref:glycoside hydrolase family 16 protein n=1 Tax=Streptacidiphilus sp. PB12-B1b TaxID=2705012 RepID=UPI0015F86640|nr:glycoside hydrolase family 16 protein [Streptacidiphilus sp. PB12-B1b]QMU75067.1 glycoside hydrolase family 16 protein [Streptacidiphilus sp. PB12-B1b]